MRNISVTLYENLMNDNDYIKYCEYYSKKDNIDINILKELLKNHKDFYYSLLKCFIFIYFSDDINNLNRELQNYKYIKTRKMRLDDLDLYLRYYYTNYKLCKESIKSIIDNKLVSKKEIRLLKNIYNLKLDKNIIFSIGNE